MKTSQILLVTRVLSLLVIFSEICFAQSAYPLNINNVWVYRDAFGRHYHRYEVVDTAISINDTNYYKLNNLSYEFSGGFYQWNSYSRITEENYLVCYDEYGAYIDPQIKVYKINSLPGDYWQNEIAPPGFGIEHYNVLDTSYYLLFGTSTKIREVFLTDSILREDYFYWSENFGLVQYTVHDFELGNYIYLRGCVINGVLYGDTTFLTVGIDDVQTTPIAEYKLYQNYPNPFNPITTIEYELKEYALVNLKVYDLLGNEVAILINEEKYAGRYSSRFNGNGLSSGVYFYKLTIGGNTQVRKMILLR